MRWSRFAVAAGLVAVLFTVLGPGATIADPRWAAPTGVAAGGLVVVGLLIGSDAALAVAVVVAGGGFLLGGVSGVAGAVWATLAAVIAVAGARVCLEARRPARVAIGAQRAVVAGQAIAVAGVVGGAALVTVLEDVGLGRGWVVAGVLASAAPLFALWFVNRRLSLLGSQPLRLAVALGGVAVVTVAVVGGSLSARDVHDAGGDTSRSGAGAAPTVTERVESPRRLVVEPDDAAPPATGEWLVALASTFVVLLALALLASNWLRDQPLEFKPAEATPGDGGAMVTGSGVEDPLSLVVGAEAAAEVLSRALKAVEDVPEPRRAIRLAYSLVEAGFGDLNVRRRASESEAEYLGRLLPELGPSAAAMRELTDLFERARFSEHPVTPGMREAAVAALVAVRADLADPSTAGGQR
jgi:hypothetical protein